MKKICILFLMLSGIANAADDSKEEAGMTKPLMNSFLKELTALKKFVISEEKFVDPKNSAEISLHLKEFASLAKLSKHDPALQKDNYRFSQQVLENYIVDTERLFRVGNKSFARWQLGSTVSVCMSCHTQMPTKSRVFNDFSNANTFSSKFEQAEFLFATRAFDKALPIYDGIIADFPMNKYEPREVESAFERELVYFVRIQRSPTEALEKFKTQLVNQKLPIYVRENVLEWVRALESLQKKSGIDLASMTDEKIIAYVKDVLDTNLLSQLDNAGDPNIVNYLQASGIMYEYLLRNPQSKVIPDLLYYLAISDRYISNTFFFSLADLYLRECILKYPTHPVAKKCYREYETETILGYTGSSGTRLPMDVKTDLRQLKKYIETGGKIKLLTN